MFSAVGVVDAEHLDSLGWENSPRNPAFCIDMVVYHQSNGVSWEFSHQKHLRKRLNNHKSKFQKRLRWFWQFHSFNMFTVRTCFFFFSPAAACGIAGVISRDANHPKGTMDTLMLLPRARAAKVNHGLFDSSKAQQFITIVHHQFTINHDRPFKLTININHLGDPRCVSRRREPWKYTIVNDY